MRRNAPFSCWAFLEGWALYQTLSVVLGHLPYYNWSKSSRKRSFVHFTTPCSYLVFVLMLFMYFEVCVYFKYMKLITHTHTHCRSIEDSGAWAVQKKRTLQSSRESLVPCCKGGETLGYHSPVNEIPDGLRVFYIVCVAGKRYMSIYSTCLVIVIMLHILHTYIHTFCVYVCKHICSVHVCNMCNTHIITRQMVPLFLNCLCPTALCTSAVWSWRPGGQSCAGTQKHVSMLYVIQSFWVDS